MSEKNKVERLFLNYQELKADIEDINLQLELDDTIKAINYDRVTTSPTNNIYSSVENQAEHIERLRKKKTYLELQMHRIENALNTLSEKDRTIMEMYYFQEYTMRDIAFKLDMNDNYISRRKTTILNNLVAYCKRHNLIN